MKFNIFIPNSRKLSLILAKLIHELGTRSRAKNTLMLIGWTAFFNMFVVTGNPAFLLAEQPSLEGGSIFVESSILFGWVALEKKEAFFF